MFTALPLEIKACWRLVLVNINIWVRVCVLFLLFEAFASFLNDFALVFKMWLELGMLLVYV